MHQALVAQIGRQTEFRQLEVRLVRVLCDPQWVMHFAKEASALAGRNRAIADDPRQRHKGRHFIPARTQAIYNRSIRGEQLRVVAQCDVVYRRRMSRQRIIGRRIVVVHVVVHRADQRHLVHDLRESRQMLADRDPIRARPLGFMLTAHRFRRVRFHVEHVDMARPAELIQKNH